MRKISVCLAFVLTVLFATYLGAQEFRGTVQGLVTDPSGAVVAGAKVTAKNINTNVVSASTTNQDGSYSIPFLIPGKYSITVSNSNFATSVHENLEVQVGAKIQLDVQLKVASTQTVETVTASADALQTSNVATGQVIENKQLAELPLAEGTAYQLSTLAPGVVYTGNPQFFSPTSNGNLALFRVAGATGANQIQLDGSPNFGSDGAVGFSPAADVVQEFKVETNNFDAQQGFTAGGVVNVVLKSGTNKLHGSLYEFNRSAGRAANSFYTKRAGQDRQARQYNRFGGMLNGPVVIPGVYDGKNKTFFLVSYEQIQDKNSEPFIGTVPTDAERNGDFSALLPLGSAYQLYDPFSGDCKRDTTNPNVCAKGEKVTRKAIAGNIIDPTKISPIAKALLAYYPHANQAGNADGTNNYFSPQTRRMRYNSRLVRIDHNISENQKIFGKYYHSWNDENRYDWAGIQNGFPITEGDEFRQNNGGNIDYTHVLSPRVVLDVRVGIENYSLQRQPAETFDPAKLGFTGAALDAMRGYTYLPKFQIRNYSLLGAQRSDQSMGRFRPFYLYSFQPTMTQTVGNHTLRYGYDFRVLRENFINNGYQGGTFYFDGVYTSKDSGAGSTDTQAIGRDLAAFLMGVPTTGSGSTSSYFDNPITYAAQSIYQAMFFQDDWRVSKKITVNLGLRYDMEPGVTERYGRIVHGFDYTTPSPIAAAATAKYVAMPEVPAAAFKVLGGMIYGDKGREWKSSKMNFMPRAGIAYELNNKTVLRAGFGLFMAPFMIEVPNQAGYSSATQVITSQDNGKTIIGTLANPLSGGVQPSLGAAQGLATYVGRDLGTSSAPIFPAERSNAKTARFLVGMQRELPGNVIVEGNMIFSRGYDLATIHNINALPATLNGMQVLSGSQYYDANAQAVNTNLTTTVANPFLNLLPGSDRNSSTTIQKRYLLTPYPQFNNIWLQQYNGSNFYKSVQVQARKRFAQGTTIDFTYTWARMRESINYLNQSDLNPTSATAGDDRPHRFTVAAVVPLPVGRGKMIGSGMNRLLDAIVGGWQVQGTYEWQSGEPLQFGNVYFNGDAKSLKCDLGGHNSNGQYYGIDIPCWDTTGFFFHDAAVQTNGVDDIKKQQADSRIKVGNYNLRYFPITLDNLRAQAYSNANMSLSKSFTFTEGMKLQLRAEAINAFNHPYFQGSNLDFTPTSASFGKLRTSTQRNLPRDIQVGAKFTF